MKKHLLYFLFAMCGMASNAQTSPSLTLHVEKTDGSERNLTFAATKAGHKLTIDWGGRSAPGDRRNCRGR